MAGRPPKFNPLTLAVALALASIPAAQAGDILRGGSAAVPSANAPTASSGAATAQAARAQASASDALARTTQALQAIRAMQNAARKLAVAGPDRLGQNLPNVPNGLVPGGLQVAPGVPISLNVPQTGEDPALWTGAKLPTQTISGGKHRITIVQTQSQALLNWKTFNVGKQTDVYFNQAAGNQKGGGNDWIAFNKISDPSGNPSQILGSLHGEGTVYLINANGILFGGSSQINLFSLVASSLPINDNLLGRGLLNNPDQKFLFSATPLAAGQTVGAFAPTISDTPVALAGTTALSTSRPVEAGTAPSVSYFPAGGGTIRLVAGTDYGLATQADGTRTAQFTAAGLTKVGASAVFLSYTASDVRYGDVVVQAGATIATPASASHTGGRVALIGANVKNGGRISTPDGQTILAAGLQVGLAAHASSDSTLRGLDAFVGAVADEASTVTPAYAGTATNAGVIESARGSTTITGKTVNQLGAIESSTTVSLNGRIDLLATYNAASYGASTGAAYLFRSSGVLTLGDGSVTRILPELADSDTVIGTRLALASIVNLQGQTIHLAGSAAVLAPNASLPGGTTVARDGSLTPLTAGISLNAGVFNYSDPGSPVDNYSVGGPSPQDHFVHSTGQIYLDGGALINAAGSTAVSAPVSENILSLQLRGSELADSPLQRDGTIRGQTLSIDIRQQGVFNGVAWIGTPLGDVSGFAGLIRRGVGELTTDGGTVNLSAGEAVILQKGSKIDVSGGYTSYTGGVVQTSRLLVDGHVVDISQATPDRIYDGIYTGDFTATQARYGLSQTYQNALMLNGAHYESGYLFGANGGTIAVQAPAMALDGSLRGATLAGPRQRSVLPTASTLRLTFHSEDFSSFGLIAPNLPPAIVFGKTDDLVPVSAFALDGESAVSLSVDRQKNLTLPSDLVTGSSGFGNLSIDNSDGSITVPRGVFLDAPAGGSVTFQAANLTIDGRVTAPSGALNFSVFEVSPSSSLTIVPLVDPTRGQFSLGTTGVLSTAGLLVDDRINSETAFTLPQLLGGGSISIRSFGANLAAGSVLDVSGGLQLSSAGRPTYGSGGRLSISTGQDLNDLAVLGGKLILKSALRGFGGLNGGGSLTLQATRIQIGGSSRDPQTLLLQPAFFDTGGFGAISLIGLGEKGSGGDDFLPGLTIAPGTQISPVVTSTVATADGAGNYSLVPTLLSAGERKPIALSFTAKGVLDNLNGNQLAVRGDLVVSPGVSITTDPLGSVSLRGDTVLFDGKIAAPGGSISIAGGGNSLNLFLNGPADQPVTTVLLGAESSLSTAGQILLSPDLTGRGNRVGQVLAGGSISVSGNLLALAGAMLDVSGASGVLDLAPAYSSLAPDSKVPGADALNGSFAGNILVPTVVSSNAGSISLQGSQELLSAATLLGKAGGPLQAGGSLTVSSGRFYLPIEDQTPLDSNLIVTQYAPEFASLNPAIGQVLRNPDGSALQGEGYFSADSYEAGGFDAVALNGSVSFVGPVRLTAGRQLTVGAAGSGFSGGIIRATDGVTLAAPYVKLGLAFVGPTQNLPAVFTGLVDGRLINFPVAATHGAGTLNVEARLIDVGNLSLQNVGTLNLTATNGDIRGDGTLSVAGAINLRAGQIYPITEVAFTIAASDYTTVENGISLAHPGSVSIFQDGNRPVPLSAGGVLSIYASRISQGGTLRAPIGTINLGWDGTGTAPLNLQSGQNVSIAQQITLQPGSVTSVSAIDPATGLPLVIPYGINLNGTSWIDPSGLDITARGVPEKNIVISGVKVTDQSGATLDLRGGGDLLAYRFVAGTDGSTDLLGAASATWNSGTSYGTHALVLYQGQTYSARQPNAGQVPGAGFFWQLVPTSFAVVPSVQPGFAPVANFAAGVAAFGTDAGYSSASLAVGDAIYLNGGGGLAAGNYTLLPARYALLPGAFLVTQKTGLPLGSQAEPGGAALVSGYRYNGLSTSPGGSPLLASFEISSTSVIRSRADYQLSLANQFLKAGALKNGATVPRLPSDAGHAIFNATTALTLNGAILAGAGAGAHGGQVDISSASDIRIVGRGETGLAGELVLKVDELNLFNAESLLIGGIRDPAGNVSVHTGNLTVDTAGSILAGSDLILVAGNGLNLLAGSDLEGTGNSVFAAEPLRLGSGALVLRISQDAAATLRRTDATSSTSSGIAIGAGTQLRGGSVWIDSPGAVAIDPGAIFRARSVSLGAGQVIIDPKKRFSESAGALALSGRALQSAQAGNALALTGYREIDFASGGGLGGANLQNLTLHTGELRGLESGTTTLLARTITLDNPANSVAGNSAAGTDATLTLSAQTIRLGANAVQVDGFSSLNLNARSAVQFFSQGSLSTAGDLNITTPGISGSSFANETITAGGAIQLLRSGNARSFAADGLGAGLSLIGQSVNLQSDILLPSGSLLLRATTGDVIVAGALDVSGESRTFYDLTKNTAGGQIQLVADQGSVVLDAGGALDVSSGGAAAGRLSIQAGDRLTLAGGIFSGKSGTGSAAGEFILDVGSLLSATALPGDTARLSTLNDLLRDGGFTRTISIRDRQDALILLDRGTGDAVAASYSFSADAGDLDVFGTIDASGSVGGKIFLSAAGSLTLESSALLTVHGDAFSSAEKSGAISLEAGSETQGTIDPDAALNLRAGSQIDLGVTEPKSSNAFVSEGQFTGTLHLRAPQIGNGAGVRIGAIDSTISGASSLVIEGYRLFVAANGSIDNVESQVVANQATFASSVGVSLLASNPQAAALGPLTTFVAGAEIINPTGNLTLARDWNLGAVRSGASAVPGILRLRAAGDLVFNGSLSDGFVSAARTAQLLAQNSNLPRNAQSWSFDLTAGADFSAADFHATTTGSSGSLLLGVNGGLNIVVTPDQSTATTVAATAGRYQVIRTGSGDIDISAAGDVRLLNQFATIYTAGTRVLDARLGATTPFDLPVINEAGGLDLGTVQENPGYVAQYSLGGGNVSIRAGHDIIHQTRNLNGDLIDDAEREMPINWLNRRGYVDPATGLFGTARFGGIASTSWWVDFSNFFEGIGALGGGNVTLQAGNDVKNVDAVVPTNARMLGKGADGKPLAPDAANLVELGGGDLVVAAGHNIDAGVYYVERGQGTLSAGNVITTNATRSPSLTVVSTPTVLDEKTWLPTTLFVGKSSFDVTARGDLLLGPVANALLLPEGVNNSYWYKTYFSTYDADSAVHLTSLSGSVTLRNRISLNAGSDTSILQEWFRNELLLQPQQITAASYQPWLRLDETSVDPFSSNFELLPGTLSVTAFSGDIDVVGHLTLSPSPTGTVDLLAAGSINALNPSGQNRAWSASQINLSDADPASIPGTTTPFAYQTLVGTAQGLARVTGLANNQNFLSFIDALFAETGSTTGAAGSLQNQQALHDSRLLHAADTDPVHLYAVGGDISGLTLYSAKSARIVAGRDLTDIGLYVQNVRSSDISVISAGRDIIAYDPTSPLQTLAQAAGNIDLLPASGDLQISGPGSLEVLAGRDFNLGVGPNNSDGTGVGLVSIGNGRNPALPFAGADLIVSAGVGGAGLGRSSSDFVGLLQFLESAAGARYRMELATDHPEIARLDSLPPEERAQLALDAFYLILRDAGRSHNDPTDPDYGTYRAATAAIATLFGKSDSPGDIVLTSREVKTRSGGNIQLFAPHGSFTVGFDLGGNQPLDQGILTEAGGNISIFSESDVIVGTSRIFTLRGGDIIIYSSEGDIAAGASSKTVQSAPPTRVLVDPQTGNVKTDLAGLATGGGIGVLATVAGIPPGNVDLIAPAGTVDAGDAGIQATGNLSIAAVAVLNADNISVAGTTAGVPTVVSASVNLAGLTSASNTAAASTAAASDVARQNQPPAQTDDSPSIITVEVLGYGG